MTRLEGKVNRVRRRLAAFEFLKLTIKLLFYLSGAAAALVLVDRFFHLGQANALIAGGVVTAGVLAWLITARRQVDMEYAAKRIDGEFALHERVSSALAVARSGEPMLPALVIDAEQHAQRVNSSRFRFRPPSQLKLLPAPMLALAIGLWAVPPMDIFGREQREAKAKAEREEVEEQARHMAIKARQLIDRAQKDKLPDIKKLALEMQKLAQSLEKAPKTKQQAMVKMSKLADEVRKQREKLARAQKFKGLRPDKSAGLEKKTQELERSRAAMQKLTDALRRGEFGEAADALKELTDKLRNGEISQEEAKKLGEALKELAKNLPAGDQLTQSLDQLGDQLASQDAKAFEEAMEQMQLTQEQMEEMQKLMQEMNAANFAQDVLDYEQMCMSSNKPSNICKTCGGPICVGCGTFDCVCCLNPVGPDGEPCCNLCAGMVGGAGGGVTVQRGPLGGRGQGQRPIAPKQDVDFDPTKLQPNITPGKILATQFLRGMPPEDAEAKSEYRNVLKAARKAAEDAVRREDMPPQCREKIKQYFEDMSEE